MNLGGLRNLDGEAASTADVVKRAGDLVPAPHHVGTKSAPSAGRLRQRLRGGS